MRKTGKFAYSLILIFCCLSVVSSVQAQQIQVEAELSETKIFSGEQVQLDITISGTSLNSVDQPAIPEIDGLRWLQGRTARSTQYSLINGQPSVTYTYTYNFIAQNAGNYTVPPIQVEVNDETYETEPIDFSILDNNTTDPAQRSPDIYLRLEPTTNEPYVGQQVVADIILYFKRDVEVSSYQASPGWKAEGFWKEELENPQRAQSTSTIIGGERYQRAKLLQYAIFPTKSGELEISPFEITVSVRERRTSRDPFGFGIGQERKVLRTLPVTLNVRSLPELEDALFVGAVGDFEIDRRISTSEALVGESIEITTTISGSGNVPLINKPDYDYPASLERYNPQQSSNLSRGNRQISGTKTFNDILIARNEGTFTIPEEKVAFFDPESEQYSVITLPEFSIEVARDPNALATSQNQLRLNVEPITGLAQWRSPTSFPLHERLSVWLIMIIPILITGILYGYKVYSERMNTDTAFARSQKANAKARETLAEAEQSEDVKKGYHLIEKALVQYITDKLNLPPAGLSSKQLISEVEQRTDKKITEELTRLFKKCESIAYAPNTSHQTLKSDIEKSQLLIKSIGKQT